MHQLTIFNLSGLERKGYSRLAVLVFQEQRTLQPQSDPVISSVTLQRALFFTLE